MQILSRLFRGLFGGQATTVQPGYQDNYPDRYNQSSAVNVTEDTALQVSAVWACSRLLSEVFASLPLVLHEINNGEKTVIENRITHVLTLSPNSRMTPVEFFETMQLNLVLHGNAYARIERDARGNLIALWPLPAQHTVPELLDDGSVVYHWYHGRDVRVFSDDSILHVRLFGNGLIGLSPLAYARNSIGLAAASDDYAAKYYVNGGKPTGVLYTDAELNDSQRKKVIERYKDIVEEREESRRLLLLPAGFKYQQTQISPEDMQMLQTRRASIKDICRFFGNVPPILICDTEDGTTLGSSIEQILIGWYRLGLNPYASRWEQALAKKLLKPAERLKYRFHIDFSALTRGDSKTQMEYLSGMVRGQIFQPNEARAVVGLPPVPEGARLNPAPTEARRQEDSSDKPNKQNSQNQDEAA